MLDQSYNYKSFYEIFKNENHKGVFDKNFYSEKFNQISDEIVEIRRTIKESRNEGLNTDKYKLKLDQLETNKTKSLENDLIDISREINRPSFNFDLKTHFDKKTKQNVYKLNNSPSNFYAMKHLIYCMKKTFGLKHTNRDLAARQVQLFLRDNSPKIVIKTDIKDFYESINQQKLFEMINDNQLLSPKSKKLIKSVLYQYNKLTNQLEIESSSRKGIPRGIGVSAYLAELYMRDIDKEIKRTEGVFYYVRYVDDIVVLMVPNHEKCDEDYENIIKNIIKPYKIILNDRKTIVINSSRKYLTPLDITFLGYIFKFTKKSEYKLTTLSENKMKKYKERLDKSFEKYHLDKKHNATNATKMLLHRVNYLTKNVRLNRPKKGLIGIYYSNQLLDDDGEALKDLNLYLKIKIDELGNDLLYSNTEKSTINSLRKLCFEDGFYNKRFFNIQSKTKKIITDNPSYSNNIKKDNFGMLTSIWK